MPSIFTATQGTVMAIDATPTGGAGASLFKLQVDGAELGVDEISGIITAFSLTGESNVQFMHTLRDMIYISVFGDKIGSMSISGLLFLNSPAVCGPAGGGTGTAAGGVRPFMAKFYEIYVVNNVNPLKIALGDVTVTAFLTAFQVQMADPQFSLAQFTMQLAALPKPDGV